MTKNIVVVGNSLLSVLMCREIGKRLGPRVDYNLTYFTDSPEIVNPHLVSLFGKLDKLDKSEILQESEIKVGQVKSVNLREKRLITTQGVQEFDYLIIDQTPYFSAQYLTSIREQLVNLFAAMSAQENIGKQPTSKVAVGGDSAIFWQLGLAIKRDAILHKVRRLSVELITPNDSEVEGFLKLNGLELRNSPSDLPGLHIKPEPSPVDLTKVKGLKLGEKHPLVDQYHRSLTCKDLMIVRSDDMRLINLISVTRAMAKRFAWNVLNDLNEEPITKREADLTRAAQLIGIKQSRLWLDKYSSRLVRVGLVKSWEKFLWQSLKNRVKS